MEKLRKQQYKDEYDRSFEIYVVKLNEASNVVQMWEQMKWAMPNGRKEVCGSFRVGRIQNVVRIEAAWKMLGMRDGIANGSLKLGTEKG